MTAIPGASFTEPATAADARAGDLRGITLDRPRVIVDVNLLLRDGDSILLGLRRGGFAAGMYSPQATSNSGNPCATRSSARPAKRSASPSPPATPGSCRSCWFPLSALPRALMVPYIRDAIASYAAGNPPELTLYGW